MKQLHGINTLEELEYLLSLDISKIRFNYSLMDIKKTDIILSYIKRFNMSSFKFFLKYNNFFKLIKDSFRFLFYKKINRDNIFYEKYDNLFQPVVYEKNLTLEELILTYKENLSDIKLVYEILSDNQSKELYISLICSRIQKKVTKLFQLSSFNQYFDDLVLIHSNSVRTFIDVGSFDGSSSIEAVSWFPKLKRIFLFDPNKESLNVSKKNLTKIGTKLKLKFLELGLSNEESVLKFYDYGSGSSLNVGKYSNLSNKSFEVKVTKLDNLKLDLDSLVYLKLDVEGNELSALQGSKSMIRHHKPLIAVCVYHKVNDLWEIPNWINKLGLNYSFYLRHYSAHTLSETVLYCIPKSKK